MEKVNRVESCFAVDKFHKMKSKEDEAVKKFIIDDLSKRVAEHLADILSSEVQPEPRWTSVTERLPERNKEVLITAWEDTVLIAWINDDDMWSCDNFFFDDKTEVSAWMPLPESYRKE